jgi:hypothetical protein
VHNNTLQNITKDTIAYEENMSFTVKNSFIKLGPGYLESKRAKRNDGRTSSGLKLHRKGTSIKIDVSFQN